MDLMNTIKDQLGESAMSQIGRQLGLDSTGASDAVSKALPMLIAGLNGNVKNGGGSALERVIEKDHDGSMLDRLGGFLESGPGASENRMLGHIFGQKNTAVQQRLGEATGLSNDRSGNLLATLAPIVMGALGKQTKQGGGSVASLLGGAQDQLKQQSGMSALLGNMLDGDGDGDVDMSDLAKIGTGLLGKFMK